jgi:hypothetical protein
MLLGQKQRAENENCWENESSSLGIEKNQDYTTVYDDSHTEIDKPQFDYII